MTVVRPMLGPMDATDLLHFHQGVAIVLACSFATGSMAIAFAGEVEAKTKGLLQRIPVRTGDLIAAKLSISLIGSYALVLGIGLIGGLLLLQSAARPVRHGSLPNLAQEFGEFSGYLTGPFIFASRGGPVFAHLKRRAAHRADCRCRERGPFGDSTAVSPTILRYRGSYSRLLPSAISCWPAAGSRKRRRPLDVAAFPFRELGTCPRR